MVAVLVLVLARSVLVLVLARSVLVLVLARSVLVLVLIQFSSVQFGYLYSAIKHVTLRPGRKKPVRFKFTPETRVGDVLVA